MLESVALKRVLIICGSFRHHLATLWKGEGVGWDGRVVVVRGSKETKRRELLAP